MHGAKRYHVGACRVEIDFGFRPPKPLSRQDSETATTTDLADRVPSLGYQEASGNEDLIDILTRIMLYLSKVFDIKNPSFK